MTLHPISGSADLTAHPEANVLLVEGDQAREAVARLLPGWVCITIEGLALDTDWRDIEGRYVWCWPDAGSGNLRDAWHSINIYGGSSVLVIPPDGVAPGWNIHNAEIEGWTGELIEDHAKKNFEGYHREVRKQVLQNLHAAEQYAMDIFLGNDNPNGEVPEIDIPHQGDYVDYSSNKEPFRFLGHNHGIHYYLNYQAQQITALPVSSHSKSQLIALANMDYWESQFAAKGKERFNIDEALQWMLARSHATGVYHPKYLRGRGAWWDEDRVVMHCGDRLIVDGETRKIPEHPTRFVYEAGPRLNVDMSNPLTNKEANQFVKLVERLHFERPIHNRLLAGFCVVAIIGGALPWRPHAYLVGESGSGKSWIMDKIVGCILGEYGINISGDTTEAAIRQSLQGDALPVVFDDTDKDTAKGEESMQAVLGLIRISSSDGRTRIIKGGANGTATAYDIRSCFIMASIGLPVTKQADATRISVLTLQQSKSGPEKSMQEFAELEAERNGLLTLDYVQRFQARAIRLIPVIRANAKIFATAAAGTIGTQRLGDQYGALLAGAYSLYSDGIVTIEQAQAWINKQDWSESKTIIDEKDHVQCLKHISQCLIRTDAGERQISELVQIVAGEFRDGRMDKDMAYNALRRYGIKPQGGDVVESIYISNSSVTLARLLQDTAWSKNWGRVLRRIEGATGSGPKRGFDGATERGTVIPIATFLDE